MLLTTIEELQYDSRLVYINRGFSSGGDFGFILFSDADVVTVRLYDSDGLYNGLQIIQTDDIERVEWNGNNLTSRMKMINKHGVNLEKPEIDIKTFSGFLDSANEHYGYCGVYDDRTEYAVIGPVHGQDDSWVRMTDYGNPSRLDRTDKLISKSNVTSLYVDSIYQRNLMMLHKRG